MIILVTGTPGSGKTLYTVAALLNGQFKDRPKLVNGIPQLLLEHTPIDDQDVENWHNGGAPITEEVIDGQTGEISVQPSKRKAFELKNALIVVDEVQRLARPRSPSSRMPEWISALETHRHKGCDFIFITQHPNQMDAHIRRLVGRHLHVRRTWGLKSAVVYEWDSCSQISNIKNAQSKVWRYPAKAFELYKSSELHTKAGGKMPAIALLLGALALAAPFVGYELVHRLTTRFGSQDVTPQALGKQPDKLTIGNVPAPGTGAAKVMTVDEYMASFKPRVPGMAHTAPAYDGLTAPSRVPLPAACITSTSKTWLQQYPDGCACYTQQGTPYQTTQALCKQFVQHMPFLPFEGVKSTQAAPPKEKPPVGG